MKRKAEELLVSPLAKQPRQERSPSWLALDAFYERNKAFYLQPTPTLFGPPAEGAPAALHYLSSADFDTSLGTLSQRIPQAIGDGGYDEVVLWLPPPGKSNFWVTLRCWPHIRNSIDYVRPCWGDERGFYSTTACDVCHLWLDDVLFTGEQMRKIIVNHLFFQPPVDWQNTWLVAAVGMSTQARQAIRAGLGQLDEFAEFEDEGEDEDEDSEAERAVLFLYEHELKRNPVDQRFYFYTGYKVADDFSIPLVQLVTAGHIPGARKEDLSDPTKRDSNTGAAPPALQARDVGGCGDSIARPAPRP